MKKRRKQTKKASSTGGILRALLVRVSGDLSFTAEPRQGLLDVGAGHSDTCLHQGRGQRRGRQHRPWWTSSPDCGHSPAAPGSGRLVEGVVLQPLDEALVGLPRLPSTGLATLRATRPIGGLGE